MDMRHVKTALILTSIALGHRFIAYRIETLDSVPSAVVFLLLFGAYLATILAIALFCGVAARVFWACLMVPAFFLYESAQRIFGEPLSYATFIGLISARGFIGDSIRLYGGQMILPFVQSALLALALLIPGKRSERFSPALAVLPIFGVGILCVLLYMRGGSGASGLPSMFTTLAYGSLHLHERLANPVGNRVEVSMTASGEGTHEDLILIMDESVRGDYLDINSPAGVYSGLSEPAETVRVHNYGVAVSASHCSAATNLIVRYGSRRDAVKTYTRTMPSIWEYARTAGYRTTYIDAQRTGNATHNGMDQHETSSIDDFVQFDQVSVLQRDIAVVGKLRELLGNGRQDFVYVNKVGAHFPVHDKYPDAFMKYKPVLPRGALGSISDTGDRVGLFDGDWDAYRNSYRNSLLWSVGEFFDQLFKAATLDDAIIVYTADHGQNFHERGEPGYNTHCSVNPAPQEGVVPLAVLVGADVEQFGFADGAQHHFNRASQFGIFPTLLEIMGFEKADIDVLYEPSLLDDERLPFSFNYTFDAALGAPQRFMEVDLNDFEVYRAVEP